MGHSNAGGPTSPRFAVLAAGQLALALMLLGGAGLLIKTTIRTFQFDGLGEF
jgi:hypothetical protein